MRPTARGSMAVGLVALLAGCSSIESTHVVRDQYGVAKGERFDGVPIVVTVPDKLGFLVTESIYEVTREVTAADGSVSQRVARETTTVMSDKPVALGKSELFTLDTRRPASGTGDASIDFAGQYPSKITNKVTDTTITDLAEALVKTKEAFTPEAGASSETSRVLVSQRQYMLVYDPRTGRFDKM